ncbi:MAG: ABC transporter ATP-binding protein [Evtepia sp.]|uniref:ABC transporter ATP-binding protein n=1 Tax=Evtepia sp. TaxID=2773933 RepID=UPI002A74B504|nr:ABC transporter ATP-binding protein [Evtepia sp.]MDY3014250.1 ABC transporter ATP-binding protein [Evtepia sp.]
MLVVSHVSKSYANKPEALADLSFTLPRGEIVGLFGENGAGKTTLMKAILGRTSFHGSITLDGKPIRPSNITLLSFATSEHSFFPTLTPKDHVIFYEAHFPAFLHQRFSALMDFFQLPMNKAVGTFSFGQKNQFEVILALSQGADYILMDEPFAGNDLFNRKDFYKVLPSILEPNETLLLSTHLLEEVLPMLDRALLLQKSRLLADVSALDMEEKGTDLLSFIQTTYRYESDRVLRALDALTDRKEFSP